MTKAELIAEYTGDMTDASLAVIEMMTDEEFAAISERICLEGATVAITNETVDDFAASATEYARRADYQICGRAAARFDKYQAARGMPRFELWVFTRADGRTIAVY